MSQVVPVSILPDLRARLAKVSTLQGAWREIRGKLHHGFLSSMTVET